MNNVQDMITRETYGGIAPVLTKERIYSFRDVALIGSGYGIATWCYVQGAYLASILPFNLALISMIFPFLAAGMITILTVTISCRFGIDLWVYQRAVFGQKLIGIVCIVAMLAVWGCYAINCQMFASSTEYLLTTLSGRESVLGNVPWLMAIICAIIGLLLAMKGPYMVKTATYIMVPCLLGIGLLMVIKILSTTSLSELNAVEPLYGADYPSVKVAFMCAAETGFGFAFGWYTALGTLARLGNNERGNLYGYTLGYIGAVDLFSCIGILGGCVMAGFGLYSADPTDWMLTIAGPVWGILALIAIALANITTQAMGCYALSLATKIVCPTWDYRKIAVAYTVFCCILITYNDIWTIWPVINAASAVIAAPAIALILIDYFFIRKGKVGMRSIYRLKGHDAYNYSGGFNLVALFCFTVSVVFYFSIYDPIMFYPRNDSAIFMLLGASVPTFIIAGGLYLILSKIPAVNKYLCKDQTEIEKSEFRGSYETTE